MITRLYVDNFRTLQDFTWRPGQECLLLGYNGAGKSSVIDAVDLIRSWASGWKGLEGLVDRVQPTRWDNSDTIRLEMDLSTKVGPFQYRLEIFFPPRGLDPIVTSETLHLEEQIVFVRHGPQIHLHNGERGPVAEYMLPLNQSALASVVASNNPGPADFFLQALAQIVLVRPMPPTMLAESRGPSSRPARHFEHFISWFQNLAVQQKFSRAWDGILAEVWEDFDYLELEKLGRDTTGLNAVFRKSQDLEAFRIEFDHLSDGERMLIVLYAILAYQKSQPPTTILIDEPDNFVSMAELQPWLLRLLDERPAGGQVILVSHNAEIIRTMGMEAVSYLHRRDHTSRTEVGSIKSEESGLSLEERIRLGWIEPLALQGEDATKG